MDSHEMSIDVWSDVVCPWCRIGRAHLQQALAEFEHPVAVTYRSFELDPTAPAVYAESVTEHLATKLGTSTESILPMVDDVTARGAAVGLDFRFDRARSGNTFDAHRVLHLARQSGQQDDVLDALFRAYFTDGEPIGDRAALTRVAAGAGLDASEVAVMLESDRFAADVRGDESEARALQVSAVPFFVIDRRYAVAGAQPTDVLLGVLRRAWSEREVA
jgi:predicted DsbA family dithiol-disulfide isomerase